jgi:hypothetical protein
MVKNFKYVLKYENVSKMPVMYLIPANALIACK